MVERSDVIDVAVPDLRLSIGPVFVQNAIQAPAVVLSDGGDDTSCAVLERVSVMSSSHGRDVRKPYPAVVAVKKQRVVPRIEHEAEDCSHGVDGNRLLLGAFHVEDVVCYAILGQEGQVFDGVVLLHEGSGHLLAQVREYVPGKRTQLTHTTVLSPSFL